MTNKRQHEKYAQYRELKNAGYQIHDDIGIRPNSGSETLTHWIAKCVGAHVLTNAGFRVDSEVERYEYPTAASAVGEVDLLAFGHEDRLPIVLEMERDVDRDVVKDKLEKYHVEPIREVFVIAVDDLSDDPEEMRDEIRAEIGL